VEGAVAAGFDTVSVDLIYGLPGQRLDAWRHTLERAVELGPDHLSCYELEVHERTTFGKRRSRGELTEMPEDVQADFFAATHDVLAAAGYPAYEVSNFARGERHRSRHNAKYWQQVPYLGLGVSAHSFDGERRFWNERSLPRYEKRIRAGEPARAGEETLTREQRALEALMLGLRTAEGVDLERFETSYGVDLAAANHERIARWQDDGLVELDGASLRPTVRGWAVADALASSLVLS
jgi:oxygen-independent coproporphyrinogen-3 oxidase